MGGPGAMPRPLRARRECAASCGTPRAPCANPGCPAMGLGPPPRELLPQRRAPSPRDPSADPGPRRAPCRGEGYNRANAEKLINPPGSAFVYSDINFVVLGELVQKVGGMPLDQYSQTYIFGPLGMTWTRFLPPAEWKPRIAPTERDERSGQMLRGVVHDPTARQMGGVAGDAGGFSTADDVAKFA